MDCGAATLHSSPVETRASVEDRSARDRVVIPRMTAHSPHGSQLSFGCDVAEGGPTGSLD